MEQPKNKGFKGYYVAILSKAKINAPFTPSDNETGNRRPIDKNIVEVDGATFYDIATGEKDSLKKLYQTLPYVLANKVYDNEIEKYTREPMFNILSKKSLDLMD